MQKEKRDELLKIATGFHVAFGEPGELRHTLWPLIVAAAGSEYFEDMDLSDKQKILIAYDEVLKFAEAACQLLQEDIKNYRQPFSH